MKLIIEKKSPPRAIDSKTRSSVETVEDVLRPVLGLFDTHLDCATQYDVTLIRLCVFSGDDDSVFHCL